MLGTLGDLPRRRFSIRAVQVRWGPEFTRLSMIALIFRDESTIETECQAKAQLTAEVCERFGKLKCFLLVTETQRNKRWGVNINLSTSKIY